MMCYFLRFISLYLIPFFVEAAAAAATPVSVLDPTDTLIYKPPTENVTNPSVNLSFTSTSSSSLGSPSFIITGSRRIGIRFPELSTPRFSGKTLLHQLDRQRHSLHLLSYHDLFLGFHYTDENQVYDFEPVNPPEMGVRGLTNGEADEVLERVEEQVRKWMKKGERVPEVTWGVFEGLVFLGRGKVWVVR